MKSALALAAISICANFAFSSTAANAATTAARTYDCSKPGNATKAACKAATPATAKTAPAAAKMAKPALVVPAKPAMAPRTMTYDCTKPGNRTKAACKGAAPAMAAAAARPAPRAAVTPPPPAKTAPPPAPRMAAPAPSRGGRIVAWTEKNGRVVHYDCSKAGNATKQACKQR